MGEAFLHLMLQTPALDDWGACLDTATSR